MEVISLWCVLSSTQQLACTNNVSCVLRSDIRETIRPSLLQNLQTVSGHEGRGQDPDAPVAAPITA